MVVELIAAKKDHSLAYFLVLLIEVLKTLMLQYSCRRAGCTCMTSTCHLPWPYHIPLQPLCCKLASTVYQHSCLVRILLTLGSLRATAM